MPAIGVAAFAAWNYARDLNDPCHAFADDPAPPRSCRTSTFSSLSRGRALVFMAWVSGGLSLGVATALVGVARGNARWAAGGAAVILFSSFASVLVVVTLVSAISLIGLARARKSAGVNPAV